MSGASTFLSKSSLLPAYATWERFNLPLFTAYVLLHISALAAPFTYTHEGLIVFLVMYFCTTCLGITLCYHRLLAHRSYKTLKPIRYILSLLGCLAFQRGPIWWVATHRFHHSEVDKELDPHSPRVSFLWAHSIWPFFWHPQLDEDLANTRRLAPDIAEDPVMRFLEKHYTSINVLFIGLLYVLGYLWGGPKMGLSIMVWGGLFRLVYTLNVTWLVNSAAHVWGYRNYKTPDNSRNNWWVALLTFGEGWHNNHHMDQRAARNGHKWFELDMTYAIIRLMGLFGLATDIIPVRQACYDEANRA